MTPGAHTSVSLLDRLRENADGESWDRLVRLYTPLIRGWLRRYFVREQDVEDIVQDVMAVVVREMPGFLHNGRTGAFRNWLRQVLVNRVRIFRDKGRHRPLATGDDEFHDALQQLEDPACRLAAEWNAEHDRHVVARALELIRGEFPEAHWQAFQLLMVEHLKPAEVAARLAMTPNAVYIAKSRIMTRLRQEIRGLLD